MRLILPIVTKNRSIHGSVVDDLDLARPIASARRSCRILDATALVRCRMYRGGRPDATHRVGHAALLTWAFTYARLRLPLWPALLYPLTFLGFLAVAVRSFLDGVRRCANWKGRRLGRHTASHR